MNMNRRDFLKSALAVAAFSSVAKLNLGTALASKEAVSGGVDEELKVTRRPYRNTGKTLPLLGFGLMRLPQKDGKIDDATAQAMVERALQAGCNYFDTAYIYHGGDSERFVGRVLSKVPRERYYLTSKMPIGMMNSEADNERIFQDQLARTKAGYFDFYLLHALNRGTWEKAQRFKMLEFLKKMKAEGKIRHIGFSFHDTPEVLEKIASAHPWELVMIQLNYLDWALQKAGEQYRILTDRGIPVAIMEPLKGGTLVSLTPESRAVLTKANPEAGTASWGLRYAASLPNVQVVLSGMSVPQHMEENIRTFSPFRPLTDEERATISRAVAIYRNVGAVPCTACKYCIPCPVDVDIPRNLAMLNELKFGIRESQVKRVYEALEEDARASSCVNCGACLRKCPQKIDIPARLAELAKRFG